MIDFGASSPSFIILSVVARFAVPQDVIPLVPVAGEAVPPGEAEAIEIIKGVIDKQVREDKAKAGIAHRAAHAKAHCCVKAEVGLIEDLPAELRVGVFAAPRTYDAWIRFSN